MSFGLSRGRALDPGSVGLSATSLPPLPDDPASFAGARIDPGAWFDQPELPLELEIGSGKGAFLIEAASSRPGVNFLGIEWAKEFWLYAADRCRRRNLTNVRLLCADATEFLRWRTPDERLDVVHLYFSDPWPKNKHHKRRVVQDRFLAEAHRALKPGGQLRVVTDHDEYWRWMEECFLRWRHPAESEPGFDRLGEEEARAAIRKGRGATDEDGLLVGANYERKFVRQGRTFHAAVLQKRMCEE